MKTVTDFINYVFGLNRKPVLILLDVSVSIATIFAGAFLTMLGEIKEGAVENFDYFLLIISLVCIDFVSGVSVAAKQKTFETRKATKLATKLISFMVIFVLARLCVRVEPILLVWLPQAVVVPMVLFTFASFLKNLSLLGVLPMFIAEKLYKHIDAYKNPEPKPEAEPPENKEQKQY